MINAVVGLGIVVLVFGLPALVIWARSFWLPKEVRRIERLSAKRQPPIRPAVTYTERMLTCRHNGTDPLNGLRANGFCPRCPHLRLQPVALDEPAWALCTCCEHMYGPFDRAETLAQAQRRYTMARNELQALLEVAQDDFHPGDADRMRRLDDECGLLFHTLRRLRAESDASR